MTGKNRRHYHCKALNSLLCADVPLRNYSLTHSGDIDDSDHRNSDSCSSHNNSMAVCPKNLRQPTHDGDFVKS